MCWVSYSWWVTVNGVVAVWKIVAQAETRNGEWTGSVQVPEFYVDVYGAHAAQETAVRVLTEGRTVQGPIHFTMTEVNNPRSVVVVTVIREGDELPEVSVGVVHKLVPERVVPVV